MSHNGNPLSISHDSYPHIIAAILAAADRSTLLHLRFTSHSIRAAVDAFVFSHAALTAELLPSAGDEPPRARVALREPYEPYRNLPFEPREVGVQDGAFVWRDVFKHWPPVAMLDTYGLPPTQPEHKLGLKVLRDWTPTAHRVLDADCVVWHHRYTPMSRPGAPPAQTEPFSAPTVVLHAEWRAVPGFTIYRWGADPGPAVREIVYVFSLPKMCAYMVASIHWTNLVSVLSAIATALGRPDPPHITVAGFEDLPYKPEHDARSLFPRWIAAYKLATADMSRLHLVTKDELRTYGRFHPVALEAEEPMPDKVWLTAEARRERTT